MLISNLIKYLRAKRPKSDEMAEKIQNQPQPRNLQTDRNDETDQID